MNNWNQLLAVLDTLYAKDGQLNSRINQTKQDFDNETNEHVVRIEYRYRMTSESIARPRFPLLLECALSSPTGHSFRSTKEDTSSEIACEALKRVRESNNKRQSRGTLERRRD